LRVSGSHVSLHRHHLRPNFLMLLVAPHLASHAPVHGAHAPSGGSPPTTSGSHVPDALLSSAPPIIGVADFWAFLLFIYFYFILLLGFSLPLGETLVFWFVLVPLFFVVPDLNYFSIFTASAIFGKFLKWR
jgi:hypothetical protein